MKIYTWAVIFPLLFTGSVACAQNTDSLKKELAKATSAEKQSEIAYTISKLYFDRYESDTAIIYCKRSVQAARRAGYDTMYMEACALTSRALRDRWQYKEAMP